MSGDRMLAAAAQTLPQAVWSDEAEQSVLGAILLDNAAFAKVRNKLRSEDFYDSRHGDIWSAMALDIKTNRVCDIITLHETLKARGVADECGGTAYLNALAESVPSAASISRYAEIVLGFSAQRTLIAEADDVLTIARQSGKVADKLDHMLSKLNELQRKQVRKLPQTISELANARLDYYTALQNGEVEAGWSTGIRSLDRRLSGGLRPGMVVVLAARPGGGKSSFAQGLAQHVSGNGHPTLFLSLEMGETELADRGVSSAGQVSYSALMTGKLQPDDWSRASEAMERLARLPLYIDDQSGLTMRDIRIKAQSVKGLKVLVLDYLQLCAGTRRDGNRNAEIEEISRGLKSLAKDLGIAVIALSQLNRDVEKRQIKRPTLSDLRDSGAIEQDADVVMFLWPVREFENEGRRLIGMGIDKNRQGTLGDFGLDFYGDTQTWRESTADIRPAPGRSRDDL